MRFEAIYVPHKHYYGTMGAKMEKSRELAKKMLRMRLDEPANCQATDENFHCSTMCHDCTLA